MSRSNGNILSLVSLAIGLIIAAVMLGLTFNNLMFSRTHAQSEVDVMAMTLAAQINEGNRVGQINELVEASRELVFDSRANLDACNEQGIGDFSGLFNQLADDARMGQALVEKERVNQIQVITRSVQDQVVATNKSAFAPVPFGLPWLRTSSPQIGRVVLGGVRGVNSNVVLLTGIEDLAEFDLKNRSVAARSHLFLGNSNLKLPIMDRDLDFKLTSLPACVAGATAPCRNFSPEMISLGALIVDQGKPTLAQCDQIPSAVAIYSTLDADARLNDSVGQHTALKIVSAATTNGASLDE
jgi:hypothetical protein